jgi:hypothetical protein
MIDFEAMLDQLRETGTLDSESLALLEDQPQGTAIALLPLEGVSDKQIRYGEKLRLQFFMRHVRTIEQMPTVAWLCNATLDAAWWITVERTIKNPLDDQWALRVLFIDALIAEQ